AIDGVHLVEVSPGMRRIQRLKLCGNAESKCTDDGEIAFREKDGLKFVWHNSFEEISGIWSIIVAHEFFDALPIHGFERKDRGPYHFCFKLNPWPTLPAVFRNFPALEKFRIGDRIEISPESWKTSNRIAKFINRNRGASLIIDYGKDFIQGDTLRAIKRHKFIHPLCTPGLSDLSADVNFKYLKEATEGLVDAYGPITQSKFLQTLGLKTRLMMLLKSSSPDRHETLISSFKRLIDPLSMGEIYKVLAFVPTGSSECTVYQFNVKVSSVLS
ncbi:7853_t:CDS:2, partial [Acaulospora colombiana]